MAKIFTVICLEKKKNKGASKGGPAVIQTASKPENVISFFMYSPSQKCIEV